jgi:hypothetical protein
MRVTIGLVGILGVGLSVTVALAQGPVRGARLLPPQPLEQAQTPTVARGAAADLPLTGNSTPVMRPGYAPITGAKPAGGPAWLNGTGAGDANVRPAAGTAGTAHVRPLTPREDLTGLPKGIDKLKGPQTGAPPAADPRNAPTATTPFQGTAANGQPVYAGPPAYRWYGWGSVTPGANPLAPTGRYPNASANWYSITGATPGAFPVPVMNPSRPAPGTEPPAYVNTPTQRRPAVSYATPLTYQQPAPTHAPAVDAEDLPPPTIIPPQKPLAHAATPDPAKPVTVPTIAPPPAPGAPPMMPGMEPLGSRTDALPVAPPATEPVPLPALPAIPAGSVGTAVQPNPTPSPLPVSVTEDQKWQPGNARPATNDWNRGGSPTPLPVLPQSRGNEGAATTVARGQVGDSQPDPTATLIRRLCESRAGGIDIRWTGTKKLTVCFDCPTATEARKLVEDISGRPELTAYQIDFRVVVK